MSCEKFEYLTTSGNRVIRLYKDIRRRSMNDSFLRQYDKIWNRLRSGGQIKPIPAFKSSGPYASVFANSRHGYTRGSNMCAERRASILAGRAKGAVYRGVLPRSLAKEKSNGHWR
jgi:hypothetical protein